MTIDYAEKTGDQSPGRWGLGFGGGRHVLTYVLDHADINTFTRQMLGNVDPDGAGGLKRTLPVASPLIPWLYAERISDAYGLGKWTTATTSSSSFLAVPTTEETAQYPKNLVTIEYTPRPYVLLDDGSVPTESVTWTTPTSNTTISETLPREDARWCSYPESQPAAEFIEALFGTSELVVASGTYRTFPGKVKMLRATQVIRVRWYQVPVSYLFASGSYIRGLLGRINYGDIRLPGLSNRGVNFPAGTLLYYGVGVKYYPHPVPETVAVGQGQKAAFVPKMLMDVEFIFLEQNPERGYDPGTLKYLNHIARGHNLFPNFSDRKWYFARVRPSGDPTPAVSDSSTPAFFSAPFQLLFVDPEKIVKSY